MTGLGNPSIAKALDRIAKLMELEASDRTRPAACRKAAEMLRHDVRPLTERIEDEGVEGVRQLGIGFELSGLITEWVRTGQIDLLRGLEARAKARLADPSAPGLAIRPAGGAAPRPRPSADSHLTPAYGFGPRRFERARREHHRPQQLVLSFVR